MHGRCDDCGDAPATREWDVDFDATIEVCASCWKARDAASGPDPDDAEERARANWDGEGKDWR